MKYAVIRTKTQGEEDAGFYTDCFEVVAISGNLEDAQAARNRTSGYYEQDVADFLIIQVW